MKRSSRCCASSSTMLESDAGSIPISARRLRTISRQSCMRWSYNAIDRVDEGLPAITLFSQTAAAGWRDAVQAPAAGVRFFNPTSFDAAAALESVEERIQRRGVETKHPV